MHRAYAPKAAWSYVLDTPTRVLVADDDPILREFAIVHLSSPAATIVTACDGEEAFALLNENPFDIAILDIDMPGLNGFALLEKIRAEPALVKLPVMMLTGNEDIASIDHAFNLGATAFASKPVNWRLLSYQIRSVLRSSQIEDQLIAGNSSCEVSASGSLAQEVLRETNGILTASPSELAAESRLLRLKKLAEEVLRNEMPEGASTKLPPLRAGS